MVHSGRLYRLPDGFLMMAPTRMWPLAVTPLLSPLGKLRAALEYFIPPRKDPADESMAAFVRRRLGREVFERLVEPLVSAVYAADMEKLSVLATLPRFREMEREHGSLIRAMRRQKKLHPKAGSESGARYSMFVTLRDGLSSLVDALAARLPAGSVRLNAPVERLERTENHWRVWTNGPHPTKEQEISEFDALILATPSWMTAKLLEPIDADLARDLAAITHEGTAIVSLGYRRFGKSAIRWTAWARWCRPSSRARSWRSVSAVGNTPIARRRAKRCCGFSWAGHGNRNWPKCPTTNSCPWSANTPKNCCTSTAIRFFATSPIGRAPCRSITSATKTWSPASKPAWLRFPICNWPATPITASASPTASTAANWRRKEFWPLSNGVPAFI